MRINATISGVNIKKNKASITLSFELNSVRKDYLIELLNMQDSPIEASLISLQQDMFKKEKEENPNQITIN